MHSTDRARACRALLIRARYGHGACPYPYADAPVPVGPVRLRGLRNPRARARTGTDLGTPQNYLKNPYPYWARTRWFRAWVPPRHTEPVPCVCGTGEEFTQVSIQWMLYLEEKLQKFMDKKLPKTPRHKVYKFARLLKEPFSQTPRSSDMCHQPRGECVTATTATVSTGSRHRQQHVTAIA